MANTSGDGEATAAAFSGAEHFLVGLSPQYWAHAPLMIGDLCNLGLVDGVDCLVVKNPESSENACESTTEEEPPRKRIKVPNEGYGNDDVNLIPLSKCHIEGIIVNAERKSNGSVLYLLDDGTGLVDCIAWTDDDLYSLPPLLEPNPSEYGKTKFRVGDVVRVMGKIRCVAVGTVREKVSVAGKPFEVRDGIREVQVNLMEHAIPHGIQPRNISLDLETKHWLDCIQFRKRGAFASDEHTIGDEKPHAGKESGAEFPIDDKYEPLRNGADVLQLLGREVLASVSDRSDFPGSNDTVGAWRLFGASCQCNVPYKESLLYCHCQATTEALDPRYTFRDAVLGVLLQMERAIPLGEDLLSQDSQLRFHYNEILNNEHLVSLAQSVASKTGNPAVNTRRLYIDTFRALRKDGILHLVDRDTDTYLLVSRERVLEPYLRMISGKGTSTILERKLLRSERPAYLANVSSARIQYIKKCLKDESS